MSEPSSLYARVRLSQAAFAAFQSSTPKLPSDYHDWLPWLANRQFYGEITEADIYELNHGNAATVDGALLAWMEYPDLDLNQTSYDPESQTWRIGVLQCSENYYDYMLVLSFLRGIAAFKDLPGEDFILITPYLWGGPPEAYVVVTPGSSRFNAEIPDEVLAEANAGLQKILEAMENEFGASESNGQIP
jgi:hypothetical protein